ncbi:hypothetical protein FJQ87_14990 [Shewanella sp. SNU WT4]|uniref:hypothetical protein n=1 Tax=Shewanella sp. SNU WT4 TaxID=2590015 RepID=UPI0011260FCF|nr:hypothetical protein [Shewanella sp. SNU WT4]QDF67810.1 hypothetical protein FJQ87_14990 [Shewanella sp. SNU WT4]
MLQILALALLVLMTGCVNPNRNLTCAALANTPAPQAEGHYSVVVTHINGKPVVSAPIFYLAPGTYNLTIMMPHETVVRGYKHMPVSHELSVHLLADHRYQLGGVLASKGVWHGDIWQTLAEPCSMAVPLG